MSYSYLRNQSNKKAITSEDEVAIELMDKLKNKYSNKDIRDIYRIIHLLLEVLTEDEEYKHNYNKYTIIMSCLHQFYASYPNHHAIIQSYSVYVSEKLHELKRDSYEKIYNKDRKSSFCKYCVIS